MVLNWDFKLIDMVVGCKKQWRYAMPHTYLHVRFNSHPSIRADRFNCDDSRNQNDRLIVVSLRKTEFKHSFVCCGFSFNPMCFRSAHTLIKIRTFATSRVHYTSHQLTLSMVLCRNVLASFVQNQWLDYGGTTALSRSEHHLNSLNVCALPHLVSKCFGYIMYTFKAEIWSAQLHH